MKKAFVFDFDDTLATTDCKVLVRRRNSIGGRFTVRKLTPAEFNTDVLADGEEYDFSEFRLFQGDQIPVFETSVTANGLCWMVNICSVNFDQPAFDVKLSQKLDA